MSLTIRFMFTLTFWMRAVTIIAEMEKFTVLFPVTCTLIIVMAQLYTLKGRIWSVSFLDGTG